jgi:diguanylate cyclase (GGDEF)-like protein
MHKLLRPFTFRLIALCMIALLGIIAAIHATIYTTAKEVIEDELELGARGVAIAVASTLTESVDEYKELLETKDAHSDFYQRMREYFASIKNGSNIKYIYTERRLSAQTSEYILDAEPVDSPYYSPPGSIETNDRNLDAAYATARPVGYKLIDEPRWGRLLGAYAPISDRNGDPLGIVGVDLDGSNVYHHLNRLHAIMLATYVFIIGLTCLVLIKYSGMILAPVLKDKLTGAYNMRFFMNFIQNEIKDSVKHHTDLALMMLDLDHFKNVNDAYGHGFGDTVLASVSRTVGGCLRKTDCFFRYGGEEFLVMISKTDREAVLAIAERIRAAVEKNEIFNEERKMPIKITVSIGVSDLNTLDAAGAQDLLEHADKALYVAKETRNRVALFQPEAVDSR